MLFAVSIDYHQHDAQDLGRVYLSDRSIFDFDIRRELKASEWFFLETCNRREFYVETEVQHSQIDLKTWFEKRFSGAMLSFRVRQDQEAARHLFEVTASLDSPALGEGEIAHQVKNQATAAREDGYLGPQLNLLAQCVLKSGKRVRSETKIGLNTVSTLSLIHRRVRQELTQRSLSNKTATIVFVGAGDYIQRLLPHFDTSGDQLIFVNRSHTYLAEQYGGQALGLNEFLERPPAFDAMITATGAPHTLFTCEWFERHAADKLIFDCATPPDVDPLATELPQLTLLSLADLEETLHRNRRERRSELPKAMQIIEWELDAYLSRRRDLQISPLLQGISDYYAQIPQELAAQHLFGDDETVSREQVAQFLTHLGKKMAVIPILSLRGVASTYGGQGVMAAVEAIESGSNLFGHESAKVERLPGLETQAASM